MGKSRIIEGTAGDSELQADGKLLRRGSWRHLVLSQVHELEAELKLAHQAPDVHLANAQGFLDDAKVALRARTTPTRWFNGTNHEAAFQALHHAAAESAYVLPDSMLAARLPMLITYGESELGVRDPRVDAARRLTRRHAHIIQLDGHGLSLGHMFDIYDRAAVAEMVHDSYASADEKYAATRAYRNRILRLTGVALAVLAAVLVIAGLWGWTLEPRESTTTTGGPVQWKDTISATGSLAFLAVAVMGAVGGFLSGVRSVARTGGTRNPFALPFFQMLLKLPVGGLSAIVGALALQAGYFPGVLPTATFSGLLVWSVAFGAAQQGITRLVNRRVEGLIDSDESADEEPDNTGSTPPTPSSTPSAAQNRARPTIRTPWAHPGQEG